MFQIIASRPLKFKSPVRAEPCCHLTHSYLLRPVAQNLRNAENNFDNFPKVLCSTEQIISCVRYLKQPFEKAYKRNSVLSSIPYGSC